MTKQALPSVFVCQDLRNAVQELGKRIHPLWHRIHTNPETGYQEHLASALLGDWLGEHGFTVQRGVADMPTAFFAKSGVFSPDDGRCIFMAEYDALPEIGHACGHSLSGVASALAATALARCGAPGEIQVVGTPAEESVVPDAGGKLRCLKAGLFDHADAALMAHAANRDILRVPVLARAVLNAQWQGVAAHAGAAPHEGRNALNAAILGLNACNALYQQLKDGCRMNAILTSGGTLVNTIPEPAAASLQIRAPSRALLNEFIERVRAALTSGGQATGCETHVAFGSPPVADLRFSEPLLETYAAALRHAGVAYLSEAPEMPISTDAGDVSYALPCIHPFFSVGCGATVPLHSRHFAEACATDAAFASMLEAATALAVTGYAVLADASLRLRMAAFHADHVREPQAAIHGQPPLHHKEENNGC